MSRGSSVLGSGLPGVASAFIAVLIYIGGERAVLAGEPAGRGWNPGACCMPDDSCVPGVLGLACAQMAGTYQGEGTTCASVECGGGPINDNCQDAIEAVELPAEFAGSTAEAHVDPERFACGQVITAPGVWYSVVGTGRTMTASLCTVLSNYDTRLTVYCGDCPARGGVLYCVAWDDDACRPYSRVTWCSREGDRYYILVHGWGAEAGDFGLWIDVGVSDCPNPHNCPIQPTGACCFQNDLCIVTTQFDCTGNLLGTWSGPGTRCAGWDCSDCPGPADGDMDGSGATDGADVQRFVDAVIAGSTDPADVCPGDFSRNAALDPADVPPMAAALLSD